MKRYGAWATGWIRKWKQSLTVKIFCTTFLLLTAICCLTYGFIAWMMPRSYIADLERALALRMQVLAEALSVSPFADCPRLLADFAEENRARGASGPGGKLGRRL